MTSPLDIPATRAICENTTGGTWETYGQHGYFDVVAISGDKRLPIASMDARDNPYASADCEFIATARTALPQALTELDAARRRIDAVRIAMDQAVRFGLTQSELMDAIDGALVTP